MSYLKRCIGLTGILIGISTQAVLADPLDYATAYNKAQKENKILYVVVSDKPYTFPKDAALKKALDANVVVSYDSKYEVSKDITFASYFKLSSEEIKNGVLIAADYRDIKSPNYDKAVLLKHINIQQLGTVQKFCGVPESEIKVPLSEIESELIRLTNEYRAQHGRAALTVSPELMNAARTFVRTPTNTKNGHATSANIARNSGYPGTTMDILAWSQTSASEVIQDWKNSRGRNGQQGHECYLRGMIIMNEQTQEGGYTKIGASGSPGGQWVIYFGN